MFSVIRRYNVREGMSQQVADRVNAEFLPLLREMRGFVSYALINPGDGTLMSISVFSDRGGADESTRAASEWVREHVARMVANSPVILSGEVCAYAGGTSAVAS